MKGRRFTRDERVAIGELVKVATGICAVSKNRGVFALGAILEQRMKPKPPEGARLDC